MVIADRKKVTNLSDFLGSYRLDEQGNIHFIFKGTLFKDLPHYFLAVQEDATKIQ